LPLRRNLGLHGKTILPPSFFFRNRSATGANDSQYIQLPAVMTKMPMAPRRPPSGRSGIWDYRGLTSATSRICSARISLRSIVSVRGSTRLTNVLAANCVTAVYRTSASGCVPTGPTTHTRIAYCDKLILKP
jgi:hypothetical protein